MTRSTRGYVQHDRPATAAQQAVYDVLTTEWLTLRQIMLRLGRTGVWGIGTVCGNLTRTGLAEHTVVDGYLCYRRKPPRPLGGVSVYVLVYHDRADPDVLVAAFPTRAAADAERTRIGLLILRGCQLAGSGPYSYDRPPDVVEVPDAVDYATVVSENHYWRRALEVAGEWPAGSGA